VFNWLLFRAGPSSTEEGPARFLWEGRAGGSGGQVTTIDHFHEKAKSSQYAVAYFPLFLLFVMCLRIGFGGLS
jgi:hypothetical protein